MHLSDLSWEEDSVDATEKMLFLSIKALEADEHKKAIAEYTSNDSGNSGASLGDILGADLNKSYS